MALCKQKDFGEVPKVTEVPPHGSIVRNGGMPPALGPPAPGQGHRAPAPSHGHATTRHGLHGQGWRWSLGAVDIARGGAGRANHKGSAAGCPYGRWAGTNQQQGYSRGKLIDVPRGKGKAAARA